ncbi:MAG TPA: TonB-dependent receptor, partial [Thermoanaerobaculia bacterium]|nr:TonB-dependent receptor [Thermoanaerobaculia bacterium]
AGFFYYDYAALIGPYILLVTDPNPPSTKSKGQLNTAFLQDSWHVADRLTAQLGFRYDRVSFDNDAGSEVADMNKPQPRLGLAWDILGDATTVASVSWGRFMHPSATTLPSFARTASSPTSVYVSCSLVGASSREECEEFLGPTIADPDNTDPNGFFLNSVQSATPNVIQAGLDPTYADELIVRLERQLLPRTSVTITYVDKDTKDIFEDTCIGNAEDGFSPTADCSTFEMANLGNDVLRRDYKGAILTFESRAKDWLHVLASYTYAKSKGSVEYTQNAGADFDHFPEHFDNTYGYLSDDRRHRVKINGYALLPWDLTLGVDAFWSSAAAFDHVRTPTQFGDGSGGYGVEYIDPRGSHRGNTNYQLDLELKKGFTFGSVRAFLIGSVFNVLDSERVTGRCERDICTLEAGTPNEHEVGFLEPTAFQVPRSYEVGVRLEF